MLLHGLLPGPEDLTLKRSSAPLLGNAVAVSNPALRIFLPKTQKTDSYFYLPNSVHTG